MNEATSSLIFIILAFSLGAILVMKRDTLPPRLKRGLALSAIVMIAFAFFIIVYSFYRMGS